MEMKKYIYKIGAFLAGLPLLAATASCDDWFEIMPQSEMVAEDFWKDEQDVESAVGACYRAMLEDGFMRRLIVWGELRSDNVINGTGSDTEIGYIMQANITESNSYCKWGDFYTVINYCNTVLQNAPAVRERDADFTEADLNSAVPQAVISKQLARKLFGEAKAVGREIMVDQTAFRVCGVVADVSKAASVAYGDLWVPYTTFPQKLLSSRENMVGPLKVAILARNTEDFEAIRQEISRLLVRYNSTKQENEVHFYDYPVTQWSKAMGTMGTHFVDPKKYWLETGSLFLFLLLVPVLNLLGVTQSSVRKRQAEIGVRKAFGASRWVIVCQLLFENGVITLLGGFVGLILSLALFPFCKDFMLPAGDAELSGEILFRPTVFLLALLFCLLFNLLSVGMPAWWIVRKPIYEALRNGEETNK